MGDEESSKLGMGRLGQSDGYLPAHRLKDGDQDGEKDCRLGCVRQQELRAVGLELFLLGTHPYLNRAGWTDGGADALHTLFYLSMM